MQLQTNNLTSLPSDILRCIANLPSLKNQQSILRFVCKRFQAVIPPTASKITLEVIMISLAKEGHLNLLKYVASKLTNVWKETFGRKLCAEAAGNGHIIMLKWLRSVKCPWDKNVFNYGAAGGHLELLKWAKKHGCKTDYEIAGLAAKNGHRKVIEWAIKNGGSSDRVCYYAAAGGQLEILKWARQKGFYWAEFTLSCAAKNGHFDILRWALVNGGPLNKNTIMLHVASGGGLEIMKRLFDMGCILGEDTFCKAAETGNLDMLRWLWEKRCPFNATETIAHATLAGQIEVLQWLKTLAIKPE